MRIFLAIAWTCIKLLGLRFGCVRPVLLEHAREREFAQPVADHVFGDENRVKYLAVVDAESQADKIRRNHRTPRPGLDWRLVLRVLGLLFFFFYISGRHR